MEWVDERRVSFVKTTWSFADCVTSLEDAAFSLRHAGVQFCDLLGLRDDLMAGDMNFPSPNERDEFAPQAGDSMEELHRKAVGMVGYLRKHEAFFRMFAAGAVDERLALWGPLADLLARAATLPELAEDARLEAQRVWAEEMHLSALVAVTMGVHARTEAARRRFADEPGKLEEWIALLDRARPAALKLIPREELDTLRAHGFLFDGE
jgi:hypothetical protein